MSRIDPKELLVITLGGNAVLPVGSAGTIDEQFMTTRKSMSQVAELCAAGQRIVLSHGNGPVVGNIVIRNEAAREQVAPMPLFICGADSQGGIGFMIQNALRNELYLAGYPQPVATVVTQVEVDATDPAFANPSKPIGAHYSRQKVKALSRQHPDWRFTDDPGGRGSRRVVPSPVPLRIVEVDAIRTLASEGFCVIAAGGGGIPVIRDASGDMVGVDAVVDKDLSSSLLATKLGADLLVISTAVDRVYLGFGGPHQRPLARLSVAEARRYAEEGHFGRGSMLPKIQAAMQFLENGGRRAVITNPENLGRVLDEKFGTHLVP